MKKRLLLFCIYALLSAKLVAQRIDSLMLLYNKQAPQEKLYVQFDNAKYTPGQTVWFKAYLLTTGTESATVSRNFYIDWYDGKGKWIGRVTEPIVYASAAGSFTIPEKYKDDQLQAVAYTRWMQNFDSAFLFRKKLPVIQTQPLSKTLGIPVTNIGFYPEGGDLVEQVASIVAFKAINTAGTPVAVTGVIKDQHGTTVTDFYSQHDGMGTFRLTPQPGQVYTAQWTDETGTLRSAVLPVAHKEGVVLTVDTAGINRNFHVERSEGGSAALKRITIVATMNQQVLYHATASMVEKKKISGKLPTVQFPSGVMLLTILDADHQPLAERALFINNEEYRLDADVHFDTLNMDARGKNSYEINIPDSAAANLSLSVTDAASGTDSADNIISQLLLSSDIKGHIHNPAYYFSSGEDTVARHLDLVMLTNGWRRFKWNDVWAKASPALKYPFENGYLSIAGKIDKLKDTKIKKAQFVNLFLVATDSSKQLFLAPLQADGSFEANNLILFDTTTIYYQLNGTRLPGRSKVNINNNFFKSDTTHTLTAIPPFFMTDTAGIARIRFINAEQKRMEELKKRATLKEVVVKTKIKTPVQLLDEKYTSGMFEGSNNSLGFDLVHDNLSTSYTSVFAYLQSRVAGLQIHNAYSGEASASWRGGRTALFIDEIPAEAINLSTMPMSELAYVKVFRPPFMGAVGGGGGGAIAVYTRKGEDARAMMVSGLDQLPLIGYTKVKEFYSPDYAESRNAYTRDDFRRTLYWNPFILTDGVSQKIRVSFYNNDVSHSLQFILEGVTQDGRLVHISKLLQ